MFTLPWVYMVYGFDGDKPANAMYHPSKIQVCNFRTYLVNYFLMNKKTKPKIEVQLERETFKLKANKGGGILSFEVWGYVQDGKTIVTRYNLAYINPLICQKDNGRVLGFDNAHNYHHRHYMGKVAPVEFENYEQTLEQFQEEWQQIVKGLKKVKK